MVQHGLTNFLIHKIRFKCHGSGVLDMYVKGATCDILDEGFLLWGGRTMTAAGESSLQPHAPLKKDEQVKQKIKVSVYKRAAK